MVNDFGNVCLDGRKRASADSENYNINIIYKFQSPNAYRVGDN